MSINPYQLLGVEKNSNINNLKEKYYFFSLVCHPEKGGNKDDMIIINNAYNFIKSQLENTLENTLENKLENTKQKLEEKFRQYCKDNSNKKLISFSKIYEESHDWIKEFNNKFELNLKTDYINHTLSNNYEINIKKNTDNVNKINMSNDNINKIFEGKKKIYKNQPCNCTNCFKDTYPWTMQNI